MTGAKCVLVIDDEDSVRSMIETALTKAGYQVFSAANGIEGLKVLETQTVELVLTDVLMPEKEGAETIVEIRQRFPSVRIIAMSGGGRTENMRPLKIAGDLGADVLLAKPFDLDKRPASELDQAGPSPTRSRTRSASIRQPWRISTAATSPPPRPATA